MKIGAFLGSFGLGVRESLEKAREIGLAGIQLSNVKDELDIEKLSGTGIKELKDLVESYGLAISAVCGDLGGHEFTDESDVEERIKRTKRIMDVTKGLDCSIVQTHIGKIPESEDAKERKVMKDALEILGQYGEKIGCFLATETGPEPPSLMHEFLSSIKYEIIKVNYDPANLIMKGYDPIKGVEELKDYIIHTHAKDGKKNNGEVPLGEGDVDFRGYLEALKNIDYQGF
ncbi:MAG: sugar phosphate isomerase/epimerase, partial [Candidatus Omnitrophica bacterium]|nr:sugar phosphate isomerase/epimerase [Candidatus Omnitrophota bacterium]